MAMPARMMDVVRAAEGLELTTSTGPSGFTGVYLYKGKYHARIGKEGKQHYLGSFDTAEGAALCYARAKAAKSAHMRDDDKEEGGQAATDV